MRNDERMLAVRTKFEHLGYSIWNMVLEKLTDAENFELKYNKKIVELWAGDFRSVLGEELYEIIEYFLDLELLVEEDGVIFSPELKKRLQPVLDKRDRERIKSGEQKRGDGGKFVADNSAPAVVSVAETPQSKVKETKVNKTTTTSAPAEDIETSKLLFKKLWGINPAFRAKFKDCPSGAINVTEGWAKDISKLRRIDKATTQQIELVITYIFGGEIHGRTFPGDTFWQPNIMSGFKLRKQFMVLVGKIGVEVKKEEESKGLTITR